jgi:hypothetical protein
MFYVDAITWPGDSESSEVHTSGPFTERKRAEDFAFWHAIDNKGMYTLVNIREVCDLKLVKEA